MKTLKELFTRKKAKEEHSQPKSTHEQGSSKKEHRGHSHGGDGHNRSASYQCPMKCEGNKTYDAPGNCPVCNMKLVAVDSRKNSQGHSHGCC